MLTKKISGRLKDFVFKMQSWQIILLIISVVILILISFIQAISFLNLKIFEKLLFLTGIAILLMFNRMLIISKFGIRFSYFFLFGIVLIFGPITALLIRVLPAIIHLKIATIETKLDFILKQSDVSFILKQTVFSCGLILFNWIVVLMYKADFIVQNLTKFFVAIYLVWTALVFAKRIIFGQRIASWRSLMPFVALLINYYLFVNFGLAYINHLEKL